MSTWSTRFFRLLKDGDRVVGAFGYERERGRFKIFRAKAVVLATGGIGRAYKITSNSWEYTGDGHALAYDAGAELIDMEFVQFHPTGMVWPPSVMGILVTEGVRGEGGILTNKDGKRFMFDAIPENYRAQTADNEEEGWRYCQGDKNARRPPELLTRDHVARCIVREIKEGRGSPHGGVYLDISWIKEKIPNAAEHIKRKLPSMYHQFKQLADIDITEQPMEVGPTTHYIMGGVHVDADTQMSRLPGLVCGRRMRGRNQWRESPRRQFALRSFGFRKTRRRIRGEIREGKFVRRNRQRQDRHSRARSARAVRARRRRKSLSSPKRFAGNDAGQGRHRAQRKRNAATALEKLKQL